MSNKKFIPYAAITFVMLIWGLSFPSIKVSVAVLAPMTLALFRFIIASIILFLFLKIREPKLQLDRKDLPAIAVSGIFAFSVYFFFENNGLRMTTASAASIIIATVPIFVVIADFLFYGNKITRVRGLGVALSFLGVYLTVTNSGPLSLASAALKGNLMMFGAVISSVIYTLLSRQLRHKYTALAITTYQTIFGTLVNLPFAFFEHNKWAQVDSLVIGNVLFLGIFCSAIGYYLYVFTIGRLGVGKTALFVNLVPLVTIVSSYFLLREKITSLQILGGGIILAAVYLVDLSMWVMKGNPRVKESQ